MEALLFLSVIAVLALSVVAFRAISGLIGTADQMRELAESAVSALAQVKGLPPHQAAPNIYSPGGQSWDAIEKGRAAERAKGNLPAIQNTKGELSQIKQAIAILEERQRSGGAVDEDHLKELRGRQGSLKNELRQLEAVNG